MKMIDLYRDGKLIEPTLLVFASHRNYSAKSKINLANAFMHYCTFTGLTPTELLREAQDEQDSIRRLDDRMINVRLAGFREYVNEKLSPSTARITFNAISYFYKNKQIQIPMMRSAKITTLKENRFIPTADDIREALGHVFYRDKAIILLQCSSGMGTAELLSLTRQEFLDGVDRTTMITTIKPTRAKTQTPYITFCSPEATKAVLYWLDDWKGESLFGLKVKGLVAMYSRINESIGKEKGVYGRIRSHNLRKFFNNELLNAGMSYNLVWFLSGRSENSTQKAYYDWKEERLREEYIKFVKHVSVTEVVVNLTPEDVKQELDEMRLKLSEYEEKFKKLDMIDEVITLIDGQAHLPPEAKALLSKNFFKDMGEIKNDKPIRHPHDDRPDM